MSKIKKRGGISLEIKMQRIVTIFIFLLIFFVRLPYISNTPFEIDYDWRQGDTESIARNFVEHRFNIFYPQVNYDGPLPNYVQLEFQITTFIIAILYKFFGYHYELARIVPLFFFMGSVFFVFLIAKKYYSLFISWITILLYSFLPITLYYSRAIMPEATALFFFTGAFYFFDQWMDNEKAKDGMWAGLFTLLAIVIKTTTVFMGIAFLAMAIRKYKEKVFYRRELWLFAGITLFIPFIYYKLEERIAELKFVSEIASSRIFPNITTQLFQDATLQFFMTMIPRWFGILPIILMVFGFLTLKWKKEFSLGVWCIAMVLEALLIVPIIKYHYYLIFMMPIIALLGGRFLGLFEKTKIGFILITLLICIMSVYNLNKVVPLFKNDAKILDMANFIENNTKKEDLIVITSVNPSIINASQRVGWRLNLKSFSYNSIPEAPKKALFQYIQQGAKYFVLTNEPIKGDHNDQFRIFLERTFSKQATNPSYTIYKLK